MWQKGQKCGNMRSLCLDKPVLLRGMHHGTHVADISYPHHSKHDDTKQHADMHPEDKST